MAPSIPVLPLLDVHRSVLELRIHGTWLRFHVAEAEALAADLANAVASPRWNPDARALVVRIPKAGCATGQTRIFSLSEFSRTLPNATLVG
ncbi:hypothetical protein GCM10009715_20300 [Paeniglutamicibacter psychrophenolicus]|uniref:Uncharacterized protein n=1 Tax=Paeniglutamicibacter psychrophenolicus TaxID=257454 RepID=A0ABS4WJB3_9MICC|nr:hypothetical protein [Paeniglutamicibacter psychrophenolicus]MBP2376288.1 hypothetical protein [Paeniglutamicibacter psychrophenolicus]